jgi:hypothetical protein
MDHWVQEKWTGNGARILSLLYICVPKLNSETCRHSNCLLVNPHTRHIIRLRKLVKFMNSIRLPLDSLHVTHKLVTDLVRREAKVLVSNSSRKRLPEPRSGHAEGCIRVSLPTIWGVRLDHNDWSVGAALQDGALVLNTLLVEEALTREGDDADLSLTGFL